MNTITPYNPSTHLKDHWILSQLDNFSMLMLFKEGESINSWGENILKNLVPVVNGIQGSLYYKKGTKLELIAGYALQKQSSLYKEVDIGEGILGEVAKNQTPIFLQRNGTPIGIELNLSTITLQVDSLLTLPLLFNGQLYGVLEIVWLNPAKQAEVEFLEQIAEKIAANLKVILIQNELVTINRDVANTNKNIIASINYAKRIQSIFLPPQEYMTEVLAEHFLLYEPKDIVSGDFYWVSEYGNKKIVGVVDCTGHGVPGAFMSVLGHILINEAITQYGMFEPEDILTCMNKSMAVKFSKSEKSFQGGMDLGLCLIENIGNGNVSVMYAGAKHILFGVQDGKFFQIKSDRTAMNSVNEHQYQGVQLTLKKNDVLYLTTDGYLDQANPERKRFGTMNFQQLVERVWEKSPEEQYQEFLTTIKEYQNTTDQRDDITVLMIKL